jgi:hypothetical protein
MIPCSVEILGSSCFSDCYSLSSISFESPSSLKRIESNAFWYSTLQSIVIPYQVEIIGKECFCWCKSLSSISFESPSSLKRIESQAFSFSKLKSIVIPCHVEILGEACFIQCVSLSSISFELPSSLRRIESQALSQTGIESIIIPRNVEFVGDSAFWRTRIKSMSVEDGNKCFRVDDHFLIDIVHCKLIHAFDIGNDVVIPFHVQILGDYCFFFSFSHFPACVSPNCLFRLVFVVET